MQATEVSEAIVYDKFLDDSVETMPGGWMITHPALRAYRERRNFYVFDDKEKRIEIQCDNETIDAFNYYYEVWENYHYFGLPHGGGWTAELPWVLDFIKYFDRIFNEIEVYRAKKS